jgi:hypothetical protein
MLDTELVPTTTATAKGDGAVIDVSAATNPVLLATLEITRIVEQESLDVAIHASTDGTNWIPKALAAFPQQFYAGQYPLLVDLSHEPGTKVLRAHWEVNRWGRGSETPMFEFRVTLKEVPPELLRETTAVAHSRR